MGDTPMPDLRTVSVALEQATGYDSIPTIERIYRDDPGVDPPRHLCVHPGCRVVRADPEKMWLHTHFSTRHVKSFGVDTPEEAWAKHGGDG
jgi:hypothetical protein